MIVRIILPFRWCFWIWWNYYHYYCNVAIWCLFSIFFGRLDGEKKKLLSWLIAASIKKNLTWRLDWTAFFNFFAAKYYRDKKQIWMHCTVKINTVAWGGWWWWWWWWWWRRRRGLVLLNVLVFVSMPAWNNGLLSGVDFPEDAALKASATVAAVIEKTSTAAEEYYKFVFDPSLFVFSWLFCVVCHNINICWLVVGVPHPRVYIRTHKNVRTLKIL